MSQDTNEHHNPRKPFIDFRMQQKIQNKTKPNYYKSILLMASCNKNPTTNITILQHDHRAMSQFNLVLTHYDNPP